MTTELRIQRSGVATGYFLDALIQASDGATGGGAIFAWANTSGVVTLLEDEKFRLFVSAAPFRLVVGVDSITDTRALARLEDFARRHSRVTLEFFLHARQELFHPKFAWFEVGTSVRLLVGSGNLTMGGLKKNWEAYTVSFLGPRASRRTLSEIRRFLSESAGTLYPSTNPEVIARIAKNVGNERRIKRLGPAPPISQELATEPTSTILVAEIPKQTTRQGQANFKRENFVGFFGFTPGVKRRIVLYPVGSTGTTAAAEPRYNVESASENYRFDLDLLKGITYSLAAPPIATFVRLALDEFLYTVTNVGDPEYATISAFLQSRSTAPPREKLRAYTNATDLKVSWPTSPLWQARTPEF